MNAVVSDSYLRAHRYDQAAVEHDRRDRLLDVALQPRDTAIVRDVWRYRLLTTEQLTELWWPGRGPRAGQRRLQKLFEGGYLERFRPRRPRGSFPWTYHLGQRGHRLLQQADLIPAGERYRPRAVYDYSYVLHDLHLNAWVVAYRRHLDGALVAWHGESDIDPPRDARVAQLRLEDDWTAEGLKDRRGRPLRPDALLEIARSDRPDTRSFLLEYDRTRRLDKNYDKFRRYDAFLCWWWRHTHFASHGEPPWVLFICQDPEHQADFLAAADHELTGHRWRPSAPVAEHQYVGRRRILFASESDIHAGILEARRLAPFPPRHPARGSGDGASRRVRLPGPGATVAAARQAA